MNCNNIQIRKIPQSTILQLENENTEGKIFIWKSNHVETTKPIHTVLKVGMTDKMAPKQNRALAKTKELQTVETPLVRRLKNIKNAKVQEGSWAKIWADIKEWAYVDKKPTQAAEKIQYSSIVNYANALMED